MMPITETAQEGTTPTNRSTTIVYHYTASHTSPLPETTVNHIKGLAQKQPHPVIMSADEINHEDGETHTLASAIMLAGKPIGTIQLHKHGQAWEEHDIVVVEVIMEQIAQIAENLRLLAETEAQVTKEQMIREITDKLRLAPDLKSLLELAAYELGHRLGAQHTILELGGQLKQRRTVTDVFRTP